MKIFFTTTGVLSLGLSISSAYAAPAPQPQVASTSSVSTSTTSAQTGQYTPGAWESGTNACAAISALITQNGTSTTLKPSQVGPCLQAVPFNQTGAIGLVDYVLNFTQFQSNLAYLKSPPSGYSYPAVDVISRLQDIRAKAASGDYTGEYAFELDVYNAVNSAHDGHFRVVPLLVGAFTVRRSALVSISSDGTELPKIYFRSDIVNSTGGYTPSEITQIDSTDASTFAGTLANGYQDLDASYNSAFYNPANFQIFRNGDFASGRLLSFNDTTTYRMANGSTLTLPNVVVPNVNLTGVTSGADFYRKFVAAPLGKTNNIERSIDRDLMHLKKRADPVSIATGTATGTATGIATSTASASATVLPAQLGLPTPVTISRDLSISGYFLDEQPDTAYLYIAQFTAEGPGAPVDFQDTLTDFLDLCRKQSKKKLVIDLRGNPGGASFTAYDAFKQILPKKSLITKVRQRSHAAQDSLGTIISQLPVITEKDVRGLDGGTSNATRLLLVATVSGFNAGNNLQSPEGKAFKSWKDFSPPVNAVNDKFSNFYSRDFANEPLSSITGSGVIVAGYGSNKNLATPLFDPSNITLITDGQCSSSCGLLSNLLVSQGNVSTITFGGRPNKNKMNLIGGTQGAQVLTTTSIQAIASGAIATIGAKGLRISSAAFDAIANLLVDSPVRLVGTLNVNFLDNFLADSDVPLQFRQRPADCRVFYVADDIASMRKTWARVSAGNFTCVDGGAKPGVQKKAAPSAASAVVMRPLLLLGAALMSVFVLLL